jgi:NUMOD3 motif-containing protein
MSKTPYFYIIKHNPSDRYYAGCKISKHADSLNLMTENGYQTTSKVIKSLIKEDGLKSFSILKIKHFNSASEVLDFETRFLKKVNAANNERFINLHNNGKNFSNKGGYKLRESTKNKMRKPKSQETRLKQSESLKKRPKEVYDKAVKSRKENNDLWNSIETRAKISLGNIARFSEEENRIMHSELMKKYYEENPVSEETRELKSQLSIGDKNPMYGKKHTDETKEKMKLAWKERKLKKS